MFSTLYRLFKNTTDSVFNISKLNLWFLNNIRVFKIKFLNQIEFFITSLNSLKIVKLKIFYKDYSFEDIYFFLFKFFILFFILFFIFLFV